MPRYILIDRASGYIRGDSVDFAPSHQAGLTPIEAAVRLDASLHEGGDAYYETEWHDQRATYDIYCAFADVCGAERDYQYVTTVARKKAA